MISKFLKPFTPSVTVITVNQRLCAYLRGQFDQEACVAGLKTWQTPDFLPLSAWIARTFSQIKSDLLMLNEYQTTVLWDKIITESLAQSTFSSLIQPAHIAHTAYDAWRLIKQWQIPLIQLMENDVENAYLFYQWANEFQARCQQNKWIDPTSCADVLIAMNNKINLPQHIVLAGFEEIPPQIQSLLNIIKKNSYIHSYKPHISAKNIQQSGCLNEDAEIYAMARWAQKHAQETIACVVPQLDRIRNKVERIFTEVFVPSTEPLQKALSPLPFTISGGNALAQYPIVHAAFLIWELNANTMEMTQFSHLIRTPFIQSAEQEYSQRAVLDIHLRNQEESIIDWRKQLADFPPRLRSCLKNFASHYPMQHSPSYKPSIWANYFSEQIHRMGWPGERTLTSSEYQTAERLQTLFIEFSTMDEMFPKGIELTKALQLLKQMANQTLFQPKSGKNNIHILGILEAAGIPFGRIWIMGMNDTLWPTAPSPNPFIPLALQRRYHLPRASSAKEYDFCSKLTTDFMQSAEEIIFSYSEKNNDIYLNPSPLIQGISEIPLKNPPLPPLFQSGDIFETLQDDRCDSVNDITTHGKIIHGGASILKEQAACPFRAFAKFRLAANKIPDLKPGLNLQERGIYVHTILERLWGTIENHTQLCRYTDTALQAMIQSTVEQVLFENSSHSFSRHPERSEGSPSSGTSRRSFATLRMTARVGNQKFLSLESTRLQKLIFEWLCVEKKRPTFHVIAREKTCEMKIGELKLKLRIDREDVLENGSHIIIDYKTGHPHIRDWFGERPNEPQLPLYGLASDKIRGLLFAQVRTEGSLIKGISAENVDIPGVTPIDTQVFDETIQTWDDFLAKQRKVLAQLANAFCAGQAQVDPKDESTCNTCDLHGLCRI